MKSLSFILCVLLPLGTFCPAVQSSRLSTGSPWRTQYEPIFTSSFALNFRTNLGIAVPRSKQKCVRELGAIIRGDTDNKGISLIFTGGDFSDGGSTIRKVLKEEQIPGSFFFTGDFYRNPTNSSLIYGLIVDGHYLGPHSDKHLLYCSWKDRKDTLISKQEFVEDLRRNYAVMARFGIERERAVYFVPPFEWYNATIADWAKDLGLILIDFSPGTLSTTDYTTPPMANYKSSNQIYSSIIDYERTSPHGLNGFILLLHIGTHPDRKDKFYNRLAELIHYLKQKDYTLLRVDNLLKNCE